MINIKGFLHIHTWVINDIIDPSADGKLKWKLGPSIERYTYTCGKAKIKRGDFTYIL